MIILVEPMDAPCLKLEDWWSGVGARSLLEGKLAAIVAATGISRYDAWHDINDAIADIAQFNGGVALYVVARRQGIDWRFFHASN